MLFSNAVATNDPNEQLLALLDQGAGLAKQKRWHEALSVALRAQALAPGDPRSASLAGHACHALGRDQEATEHLALALAREPRQAALWHLRSLGLLRLGHAADAYAHAERACALAPERADYEQQRRSAGAAAVPDWHFNMVNDEPRNAAFAAAIASLVKPEQRVLEIGTGSGLLAMLAARDELGAPRATQGAAVARGALVASDALARRVRAGRVRGFDLSRLNALSPIVQYVSSGEPLELLSEPFDVFRFELALHAHFPPEKRAFDVQASRDGLCQGVVQWLRLELAPGIEYENRPGTREGDHSRHWQPVFYPFPAPLELRAGQRVTLRASHNRSALRVWLAAAEPG